MNYQELWHTSSTLVLTKPLAMTKIFVFWRSKISSFPWPSWRCFVTKLIRITLCISNIWGIHSISTKQFTLCDLYLRTRNLVLVLNLSWRLPLVTSYIRISSWVAKLRTRKKASVYASFDPKCDLDIWLWDLVHARDIFHACEFVCQVISQCLYSLWS